MAKCKYNISRVSFFTIGDTNLLNFSRKMSSKNHPRSKCTRLNVIAPFSILVLQCLVCCNSWPIQDSAKTFFGQMFFRPKIFSANKYFLRKNDFFSAKNVFSAKNDFFREKFVFSVKIRFSVNSPKMLFDIKIFFIFLA